MSYGHYSVFFFGANSSLISQLLILPTPPNSCSSHSHSVQMVQTQSPHLKLTHRRVKADHTFYWDVLETRCKNYTSLGCQYQENRQASNKSHVLTNSSFKQYVLKQDVQTVSLKRGLLAMKTLTFPPEHVTISRTWQEGKLQSEESHVPTYQSPRGFSPLPVSVLSLLDSFPSGC